MLCFAWTYPVCCIMASWQLENLRIAEIARSEGWETRECSVFPVPAACWQLAARSAGRARFSVQGRQQQRSPEPFEKHCLLVEGSTLLMRMSQNQWYHFGASAPPILEPISVVGLGCSLGANRDFDPWPRVTISHALVSPHACCLAPHVFLSFVSSKHIKAG